MLIFVIKVSWSRVVNPHPLRTVQNVREKIFWDWMFNHKIPKNLESHTGIPSSSKLALIKVMQSLKKKTESTSADIESYGCWYTSFSYFFRSYTYQREKKKNNLEGRVSTPSSTQLDGSIRRLNASGRTSSNTSLSQILWNWTHRLVYKASADTTVSYMYVRSSYCTWPVQQRTLC